VAKDPYETHELSAEQPETVKTMTDALMAWYSSVLNSSSKAENDCRDDPRQQHPPMPEPDDAQ
jgi:hypothetical protein